MSDETNQIEVNTDNANLVDAQPEAAAPEAVKKERKVRTLEERLADAKALVAKIEEAIANGGTLESVAKAKALVIEVREGDQVQFNFGRSDKVRVLTGRVLGTKDTKTGAYVTVLAGEGADTNVYKARASDIIHNATADARNGTDTSIPAATDQTPAAVEQRAEIEAASDEIDAVIPASVDDEDPLNAD